MKHEITRTRNDRLIYVNLIRSPAATSIANHPYLLGLVKERLANMSPVQQLLQEEYDIGRVIGYDFVVETTSRDSIVYARMPNEDAYTRFIKNGKPVPTSYLSIDLRRDESGDYELYDAWAGHIVPPKPGDPLEVSQSKEYWSNHAIILDKQRLQTRSITRVHPY